MRTLIVTNTTRQKNFFLSKLSNAEIIENNDNFRDIVSRIGNENVILILPSSLSIESISSYGGINLALECYFHILNNNLLESSIFIYGFEDKGAFYDHCPLSDIVRCSGIQYASDAKTAVSFAQNTPQIIKKERALKELRLVRVTPPAAFKSHHTIINEWSIMRWSKYLGFSPKKLSSIDSLYFRYLNCILPVEPTKTIKRNSDQIKGSRILIIDDEIEKGWVDFYSELLRPYTSVSWRAIGDSFKNNSQEQIIEICRSEVNTFNPDIVLVDLRLHETDLGRISDENKERITGIQVIENIKQNNSGIQVIGVTASSKVWNYQKTQHLVDGYIIKESPELSAIEGYTGKAIKNLIDTLIRASERHYLKDVYIDKSQIFSDLLGLSSDDYIESIKTHLEMSFYLESIAKTPDQFAFAYVNLYQIFEIIIQKYYDDIPKYVKDTFMENIKYIYRQKLNGTDSIFFDSVKRIYDRRNAYIHQDKQQLNRLPGSNIFNKNGYIDAFKWVKILINKFIEYESNK